MNDAIKARIVFLRNALLLWATGRGGLDTNVVGQYMIELDYLLQTCDL